MGKFIIRKTNTGFMFDLLAANSQVIATSQVYSGESTCIKGAESVAAIAETAHLEDQTTDPVVEAVNPKFEVYLDKAGEYRFRLRARNGENIAASEGYKAKTSCMNGVESVRKNAPGAPIEKNY